MKINYKWFLLLLVIDLCSCATSYDLLVPKNRNSVMQNRYGAYMELVTPRQQLKGEFIALSIDSLFLLTQEIYVGVSQDSVTSFKIILASNNSDHYFRMTALASAPSLIGAMMYNEYSSEFLSVTLICGITGVLAAVIESGRKPMIVEYPLEQKPILYYQKYARFPSGIPKGMPHEMIENAKWRK